MRGIRNNSSTWLSVARRNMERFRRIAAWPDAVRMRLHLRQSPVYWMRDRLWLLERLQPRVKIDLNVANNVRVAAPAAARISTLVIQRNVLLQNHRFSVMPSTETPLTGTRGPVDSATYRSVTVREHVRQALPGVPVTHETPHTAVSSQPTIEAPLVARLARRAQRTVETQADLPTRLVRRPPPIPQAVASQGFTEVDGSRPMPAFPQATPVPAWPSQPTPSAPVNVQQLTDQVLQQLDRRLIASRERMGRI